jgi:hypothetical protein
VPANDISLQIQKIAAFIGLSDTSLHEGYIVPVGNEADILRIPLFRIDQTPLRRNGPGLLLAQFSQRETNMGQLLLGQAVENIALIFGSIRGLAQQIPAGFLILPDPGIVTGDDFTAAQLPGFPEEQVEFQVPVAPDAGIGGQTRFVAADEGFHHMFGEIAPGINYLEGHAQLGGYGTGILRILPEPAAAAGNGKGFFVEHLHDGTHAAVAFLLGQTGGNGAVNSATHCNQGFFLLHIASLSCVFSVGSIAKENGICQCCRKGCVLEKSAVFPKSGKKVTRSGGSMLCLFIDK